MHSSLTDVFRAVTLALLVGGGLTLLFFSVAGELGAQTLDDDGGAHDDGGDAGRPPEEPGEPGEPGGDDDDDSEDDDEDDEDDEDDGDDLLDGGEELLDAGWQPFPNPGPTPVPPGEEE